MSERQASRHHAGLALLACATLLGGCDPLQKPIDLYHGLEGGEIAAERPPPPGAGQPYPHIGTVPDKPTLPTPGFRTALYSQLAAERDQKEVLAADLPVQNTPPPPRPAPAAPAAPTATAGAATPAGPQAPSTVPASPGADAAGSNATIDAAEAAPNASAKAAETAPPAPPHDAALQIAGDPVDTANLPLVPDGPPAPAAIESGVAAEPAPTPRLRPEPSPLPNGKPIYFASGSDVVQASQNETLSDLAGHRGKTGVIDIIGLGEADSDTPLGQEAAIDLGLRRARAVAGALAALHVPQNAMRLSARPFGRGALVRVLP
jgi:outer membrane protein OmpA-like peptidoglycan-associated protein